MLGSSERLRLRCGDAGIELGALFVDGPRGAAVIAPPHPAYGGRLDNPVLTELAAGLDRAGFASLRFDFRGAGSSSGTATGDPTSADADYAAALDALRARHAGPYVAAGYSFGAAAALRAASAHAGIARALLVAPPLATLSLAALSEFAGPVAVIVGDDDMFSPIDELQRTLSAFPRVRLRVLAGADHFFSSSSALAALAGWAEAEVAGC